MDVVCELKVSWACRRGPEGLAKACRRVSGVAYGRGRDVERRGGTLKKKESGCGSLLVLQGT